MISSVKSSIKSLLRPAVRVLTADQPRILMYHRFAEDHNNRVVSVDRFRKQVELLKKNFTLLSMRDLVRQLSSKSLPSRNLAAITVDDGYSDFYIHAFPVLQELEVPATIYVVGGFISENLWLWPDLLRAVIYDAQPGEYRPGGFWGDISTRWNNDGEREAEWSRLADKLLPESTATRFDAIQSLAEAVGVDTDSLDMSAFAPLSWEQLRELDAAGIEIGDHTWSHCNVARQSRRAIVRELTRSKEVLESNIGTEVVGFAYPNGLPEDYDPLAARTVRDMGYEYAVVAHPARYDRNRMYEIGRINGASRLPVFNNTIAGFELLRSQGR